MFYYHRRVIEFAYLDNLLLVGHGGSTGKIIGHGQAQVLYYVLHCGAKLTEAEGEALGEELLEDLIIEQDLLEVERLLRMQVGSHRCHVDGQVTLEDCLVPLVLIREGT